MNPINALRPYRPATYSGKRQPPLDFQMRRAWRKAFRVAPPHVPARNPSRFRRFLRNLLARIVPLRWRTALSHVAPALRRRRAA